MSHSSTPTAPATPPAPAASATPSAASLLPGSELCVHCGFCLQACPTYLALDDENDSPRGRIVLMKALVEGAIAETDTDATVHLDRCLGCRACETACPSGVPYGQLLELTRERLAERRPLPPMARMILWSFAHPVLLTVAMWGARLLRATRLPRLLARAPEPIGFAMAMLDSTRRAETPAVYNSTGDGSRGTAAVLTGCVMEGLFTEVNRATERTLSVNGYTVVATPGQRCCGALHAHAGKAEQARQLARANIAAFESSGAALVVVNSAGCGTMMKEYEHLLRDDGDWRGRAAAFAARVRDVSEVLAAAGPATGARLPLRVAYDAPCHLQHGQRVTAPPLAVLAAIPGLELVPLTDNDQCCGSAGIYNLIEPDVSDRVLSPKLRHIAECGAPVVATGNPGCLMQIGAGLRRSGSAVVTRHPVELLDQSYSAR